VTAQVVEVSRSSASTNSSAADTGSGICGIRLIPSTAQRLLAALDAVGDPRVACRFLDTLQRVELGVQCPVLS
jgi:hypothetical protein